MYVEVGPVGRLLIIATVLVGVAQAASAQVATAQKPEVKIFDRQESATGYTYTAPSYFNSQSNSNINCYGDVTCNNRRDCRMPLVDNIEAEFHGFSCSFARS